MPLLTERSPLNARLKPERQAFILRQLDLHNRVLSADLSQQLGVSEDTVRRDLLELADDGRLLKVHGGALSLGYGQQAPPPLSYAADEKARIAQKTLGLLRDGMYVLAGGGTTLRSLIAALPPGLHLTVLTVSPATALQLLGHPGIKVELIGGRLWPETQICMGSEVISRLAEVRVDLYLMGATGLDPVRGLTETDNEVIQVKRAMMRAADRVAVLTISEKLGTDYRMKLCSLSEVHTLITELDPTDPALVPYARPGLEVW